MNPLYATTRQGTIGELIVQLHLLEHNIQAAAPIKDSGNDLIAIRGRVLRAIQVRSTVNYTICKPKRGVLYDILAVVRFPRANGRILIREAQIYLFHSSRVEAGLPGTLKRYPENLLSQTLIDQLFQQANC
jgi:hypothetical protein